MGFCQPTASRAASRTSIRISFGEQLSCPHASPSGCVRAKCLYHSALRVVANPPFLAPFMIHELLLSPTETASGSHPCCVVSVAYQRPSYFHGDNTGSNPLPELRR